ncbi:type II secretion system F family protein [Bacillota bacterium]
MQEYICTLKRENGEVIKKQVIKAADEAALAAQLKAEKLYIVDYRLKEAQRDIIGGSKITLSLKDIALLCRQLSSMLGAGVTLVKALNILYLQIEKKNIKASIKLLYESVQRGDQFSEAILKQEKVYPEIMISMIEAGEASGKLDHVIGKLADQFEKDLKLRSKIKVAMTYPAVIAVLCVVVVLVLVTKVLPIFLGMFNESGVELPMPTKIVLGFSHILTDYWFIVLVSLGIAFFAFRAFVAVESGRRQWDSVKLQIPLLGKTIEKIAAVRFTRTLSTLLASGMNLLKAMEVVIKVVGNRVIMDSLTEAKEDIRKGMAMSNALRKANVLPPMVYSMVGIGEEAGTIENMLERCADYFDDEVETAIQRLVGVIEPLLIVFMAVIVGFIVVAIMLPMISSYSMMAG